MASSKAPSITPQPTVATSQLSHSVVKSIAKLARLYEDMDDALVEEYRKELAGILDLADQLQQIDTQDINQFDGARTLTLEELRDDIPDESPKYAQVRQNIINNFPQQQNNLLIIQGIFESD